MINNDSSSEPNVPLITAFTKAALNEIAESIRSGKIVAVMGKTARDADGHTGTWGMLGSLAMGPLYLSRYGDDYADSDELGRLLQGSPIGAEVVKNADGRLADELVKYVSTRVEDSAICAIITVDVKELRSPGEGVMSSAYALVRTEDGHALVTEKNSVVASGYSREETEEVIFELTKLAIGSMIHDVQMIDEYLRTSDAGEKFAKAMSQNGDGYANPGDRASGIPSPSIN